MKCPKCGYLGFETGDRCRNCGYDFSLAPPSDGDLALNQSNGAESPLADLELPSAARSSDRSTAPALDLDRLFGAEPEHRLAHAVSPSAAAIPATTDPPISPLQLDEPEPPVMETAVAEQESESSVLPFDEGAPARPLRPARPPLGVRRTTPDMPRTRPRSNRPVRFESSADTGNESPMFETIAPKEPAVEDSPLSSTAPQIPAPTLMDPASIGVRLGALAIDSVLLGTVSLGVLVLTLRIAGLAVTWADMSVLPPVPFLSFLGLLSLGYVATFTVAGGQTIGKMLTGARVIGDDGRPVDVAGGVLRALGCALVPLTVGLSYGPVVLTAERRALHDRLAGTRVVRA